jgi:hypothetical protein
VDRNRGGSHRFGASGWVDSWIDAWIVEWGVEGGCVCGGAGGIGLDFYWRGLAWTAQLGNDRHAYELSVIFLFAFFF